MCEMKGLDGSNPPLSAKQSSIFGILRGDERNSRVCEASRRLKVTGESTARTNVEIFEGFLSTPQ